MSDRLKLIVVVLGIVALCVLTTVPLAGHMGLSFLAGVGWSTLGFIVYAKWTD